MRLKERMVSGLQKVRSWSGFQKIPQMTPFRQLKKVAELCGANPFPAQVILIVIYRLALDVLYLTEISPYYAYAGFTSELFFPQYAVSVLSVIVFAPFVALLNEIHSPSAILVTFLNYLYFIPLTSYCGCKGTNIRFFLIALVYWGMLLFLQFHIPVLHLKSLPPKNIRFIMMLLTLFSSAFVLFISGRYAGFRFTLDFFHEYDIRTEASTYQMPAIFSYLMSIMPIILAVLLSYWLLNKKYIIAGLLSVVYIFLFSIAAHKTVFFFLFLVLASFLFYRDWMLRWLSGFLTILSGAAILEEKIIGSFHIMSLFFRRMMYVPVWLAEMYSDFFSQNPLNLFRNGIMGKLSFENIYSAPIPFVVGGHLDRAEYSANTGMLGDLFANLPVLLGLILMPLILILCFRLLDMAAHSLDTKILLPFGVYFASSFMNGSWSTTLLSNGFLVACLMLYFYPKEEGILK